MTLKITKDTGLPEHLRPAEGSNLRRITTMSVSAFAVAGLGLLGLNTLTFPSNQKANASGITTKQNTTGVQTNKEVSIDTVINGVRGWYNLDPSHKLTAQDFSGRVTVAYFWGTYCGPCRPKIPMLNELDRNPKITVLAITNEAADNKVGRFVTNNAKAINAFSTVVGADGQGLFQALNIQAVPYAIIFGPDGKVLFSDIATDKEDLKHRIEAAAHEVIENPHPFPKEMLAVSGTASFSPGPEHTPRPASLDKFNAAALEKLIAQFKTKFVGTKNPVSISDVEMLVPFYSGNLPKENWLGDTELREEIDDCWGGLYQRANKTGNSLTDPIRTLQAIALDRLTPGTSIFEPDALIRRKLTYLLADLYFQESKELRDAFRAKFTALAQKETEPNAKVGLERLAYILQHGFPTEKPSLLSQDNFQKSPQSSSSRAAESTLQENFTAKGLTKDLVESIFEHVNYPPALEEGVNSRYETVRRVGFALSFIDQIKDSDLKRAPKEVVATTQNLFAKMYINSAEIDSLLDHRMLMRLAEIGVDEVDFETATALERRISLSQKNLVEQHIELWWTLERIQLMLEKTALAKAGSGINARVAEREERNQK